MRELRLWQEPESSSVTLHWIVSLCSFADDRFSLYYIYRVPYGKVQEEFHHREFEFGRWLREACAELEEEKR